MFCGFVGLEFLFFAKISGYKVGNSYSQEISEVQLGGTVVSENSK